MNEVELISLGKLVLEEGLNASQIAERLGLPVWKVYRLLRKHGLSTDKVLTYYLPSVAVTKELFEAVRADAKTQGVTVSEFIRSSLDPKWRLK